MKIASLALLGLWLISFPVHALEIAPTQDTEKYLEQKIEKQLELLFPHIPAVASVRLHRVSAAPKPVEKKDGDEKDAKNSLLDFGYLPFPVDKRGDNYRGLRPGEEAEYDSTLVLLQIDPRVDEETVGMMKDSIVYALEGYAPTVTIKRAGKPTPEEFQPTAPGADESDHEKDQSDRLTGSIFQLLSALLLALALVFLSFYLRKGAQAVAEALGKATGTGKSTDEEQKSQEGKFTLGGDSSPFPIKLPADVSASYERNMIALRRALEVTPAIVAQELQSSPEDAEGLRWLLPALQPAEQEALRVSLGPPKTKQLLAMASSAAGQNSPEVLEARYHWLQRFVERMALRQLRGGSPLDAALGVSIIQQLSAISVNEIERWLLNREDAAAWRVASEFVPPERLARLLEKISPDKWILVANAANASTKELKDAASGLVEERKEKDPVAAARAETRKDYFQRVLTEPLVSALKLYGLTEQEQMLETLERENPDLIRFLEARFWSLRHLRRITDEVLVPAFRELGTEEKVFLIAALPPDDARRFSAWLPEGTVQLIVQDRVGKIVQRKDKAELAAVSDFAQKFLEKLRQRNINGQFDLSEHDIPVAAAPEPPESVPDSDREAA